MAIETTVYEIKLYEDLIHNAKKELMVHMLSSHKAV